jgi:hypothetical protein
MALGVGQVPAQACLGSHSLRRRHMEGAYQVGVIGGQLS